MGLREWLTHPVWCIEAVWFALTNDPDAPVDIRITEAGRAELRAVLGPPAYERAACNCPAQFLP